MIIALEATGAVVEDANGKRSLKRARYFKPSAVVIDIDGEMLLAASNRPAWASEVVLALRDLSKTLPIIMMTSVPIDELNRLAVDIECARVLLPLHLDTAKQADQILTVTIDELGSVHTLDGRKFGCDHRDHRRASDIAMRRSCRREDFYLGDRRTGGHASIAARTRNF